MKRELFKSFIVSLGLSLIWLATLLIMNYSNTNTITFRYMGF